MNAINYKNLFIEPIYLYYLNKYIEKHEFENIFIFLDKTNSHYNDYYNEIRYKYMTIQNKQITTFDKIKDKSIFIFNYFKIINDIVTFNSLTAYMQFVKNGTLSPEDCCCFLIPYRNGVFVTNDLYDILEYVEENAIDSAKFYNYGYANKQNITMLNMLYTTYMTQSKITIKKGFYSMEETILFDD